MYSRAERVLNPRRVERLVWGEDRSAEQATKEAAAIGISAAALAEAEERAFASGYAAGTEATTALVNEQLRRLADTVEQLALLRSVIIREAEQQLVLLASAIAGRILRGEVAADPTRLLTIAHAAIDRLGDRTQATIHLHPDDHAAISATPAGAQQIIKIVADPGVQPGGCLVHSDVGTIEAGVAAQLEELTAMLLDDELPPAENGRPSEASAA